MVLSDSVSILADSLVRIHRAITRGIKTGIIRGSGYEKSGLPGNEELQGYFLYIQSLTIVLSAHHLGEDEVAFPELKKRLPDGPFARLKSDHQKMEIQVTFLNRLVTNPEMNINQGEIKKVVDSLQIISSIWTPHIGVEEKSFSRSVLSSKISSEEQTNLATKFSQHGQEHAIPPFLALPFVLFNLSGADRAAMMDTLPKEVVEELIPRVWKANWSPMGPFLLE